MRAGDLTITVSKDSLLATLKGNRAKHGEAFKKAKEGYIKVTTEQLEAYVRRLADGELLEDHTTDYDDAIDMMEWSTDGTIELTQSQFVQYVKDDWGWKDNWVASTAAYIEAAR
jgi:hypothetical protein